SVHFEVNPSLVLMALPVALFVDFFSEILVLQSRLARFSPVPPTSFSRITVFGLKEDLDFLDVYSLWQKYFQSKSFREVFPYFVVTFEAHSYRVRQMTLALEAPVSRSVIFLTFFIQSFQSNKVP